MLYQLSYYRIHSGSVGAPSALPDCKYTKFNVISNRLHIFSFSVAASGIPRIHKTRPIAVAGEERGGEAMAHMANGVDTKHTDGQWHIVPKVVGTQRVDNQRCR